VAIHSKNILVLPYADEGVLVILSCIAFPRWVSILGLPKAPYLSAARAASAFA
jgi:hypothetical protein